MNSLPYTVTEAGLLRSICRDSFGHFVRELWDTLIPEPLVWNWHLDTMCDTLQEAAERVFHNLPKKHDIIFNVPPGSSKSTIASIMFPAWVWTRMPTARSICGSYAATLAMDLSRKSRDVILSEKYQQLFLHQSRSNRKGEFVPVKLREDQNAKYYYANQYGGMRFTTSVGGTVTGMHGHFLIIDDPLNPTQAVSEADLKTANSWMAETLPTRKVDKKVSVIILIMQRLHQNDPTGNRLEKKGGKVFHVCLPAEDAPNVKPEHLRKKYVNGLLDPNRLPKEVLEEAHEELGEFGYAGQYTQNPIPLSGGMFKTQRMKIVPSVPPGKIVAMVRYWDKAGTHKGGAFTVGCKMGVELRPTPGKPPRKHFYIMDIKRGQWDSHERETTIVQTAQTDGRKVIQAVEQEPGSGGKESAEDTVSRLSGFRCRVDRVTGDKTLRADPFSSQVNEGNVSIVEGPWNETYLNELAFYPDSRYKDQVDASSGAFNQLYKRKRKVGAF